MGSPAERTDCTCEAAAIPPHPVHPGRWPRSRPGQSSPPCAGGGRTARPQRRGRPPAGGRTRGPRSRRGSAAVGARQSAERRGTGDAGPTELSRGCVSAQGRGAARSFPAVPPGPRAQPELPGAPAGERGTPRGGRGESLGGVSPRLSSGGLPGARSGPTGGLTCSPAPQKPRLPGAPAQPLTCRVTLPWPRRLRASASASVRGPKSSGLLSAAPRSRDAPARIRVPRAPSSAGSPPLRRPRGRAPRPFRELIHLKDYKEKNGIKLRMHK